MILQLGGHVSPSWGCSLTDSLDAFASSLLKNHEFHHVPHKLLGGAGGITPSIPLYLGRPLYRQLGRSSSRKGKKRSVPCYGFPTDFSTRTCHDPPQAPNKGRKASLRPAFDGDSSEIWLWDHVSSVQYPLIIYHSIVLVGLQGLTYWMVIILNILSSI